MVVINLEARLQLLTQIDLRVLEPDSQPWLPTAVPWAV